MTGHKYFFRPEPVLDGEAIEIVGEIGTLAIAESGRRTCLIEVAGDGSTQAFWVPWGGHTSAFDQVVRMGDLLAIGHGELFHLYDSSRNEVLLSLLMDGYLGHIYINDEMIYVASGSQLICVDLSGSVKWRCRPLGVDGVLVEAFSVDEIHGAGEWDPPGGWRPFVLDRSTGRKLRL